MKHAPRGRQQWSGASWAQPCGRCGHVPASCKRAMHVGQLACTWGRGPAAMHGITSCGCAGHGQDPVWKLTACTCLGRQEVVEHKCLGVNANLLNPARADTSNRIHSGTSCSPLQCHAGRVSATWHAFCAQHVSSYAACYVASPWAVCLIKLLARLQLLRRAGAGRTRQSAARMHVMF